MLKESCDMKMSLVLNQGGYSKDITGQFRIMKNYEGVVNNEGSGVRTKTVKYNVKDTAVDFFETYVVK